MENIPQQVSFRDFIMSVLRRGQINESTIAELTTDENLFEYKKVFTHVSAGLDYDYNYYEFFGDTIVNESVVFNIRRRLPKVVTAKFLTRIKHTLMSNKILGQLAETYGWTKYLITGGDVTIMIERNSERDKDKIIKIYADLFEAFCGCTVILIESLGMPHGAGVQVVHNIMNTYLDTITLSESYEEIFDPITRLKELYESKALGIKWPSGEKKIYEVGKRQAYVITQLAMPDSRFRVLVYGWPKGNREVNPRNEVLLGEGVHHIQKEAKKIAAQMAIDTLRNVYNIAMPETEFR